MKKYHVEVDWSGYSRGYSVYEVYADSAEEAEDMYYEGERIEHDVVRDDTEKEGVLATLAEENK